MNYSRGPKARNKPAQGNALGKGDGTWQAPKGRNNERGRSFSLNALAAVPDILIADYSFSRRNTLEDLFSRMDSTFTIAG